MTRGRDDKRTQVYSRCEVCGKIARPDLGRELPEGWISVGKAPGFNAPRAVCSPDCKQKIAKPA